MTDTIDTTGAETDETPPEAEAPETAEAQAPETEPEAPEETPTEQPEEPQPEAPEEPQPEAPEEPQAVEVAAPQRVPGLAPELPIIPDRNEMNDLAAMAVMLSNAQAVPAALKNRPEDVFLVLLTARDLGVALTTAMREFHVIEGRVTLSAKSRLALVRSSGLGRIWPDAGNDAEEAIWHAARVDQPGQVWSYSFTMAEARAVVDAKGKILAEKLNWKNYPKRMLSWRAAGYLLDDIFPEIGTGLYTPDEMGAVTNEEGDPIEVSAVETPRGMRSARGGQGQGGGQASEVEPPDEETAAELAARLEAVKAVPVAHDELKAWWAERQLPPARALSKRQAATVLARLNALETKHQIAAPVAAPGAPPGPPADPAPTAPAEAPGAPTDDSEDPPAPTPEVLEQMGRYLDEGEIVLWLIERAKLSTRDRIEKYAAEHELDLPDGNLQALRRWWCEQEVARIGAALYLPILLAVLGTAAVGDGRDA